MVPSRITRSTRQEWQVVVEPDRAPSGVGSDCKIIGEASFATLRSHAGPLDEAAVSLLQQSARNLLQRGYICPVKTPTSKGETSAQGQLAADPSSYAGVTHPTADEAQILAAPQSSDWELL